MFAFIRQCLDVSFILKLLVFIFQSEIGLYSFVLNLQYKRFIAEMCVPLSFFININSLSLYYLINVLLNNILDKSHREQK